MMLSSEAVSLLLDALESPRPHLSGAVAVAKPQEIALLVESGLLARHGHEADAALPHDDEDLPRPVLACGDPPSPTAFDPTSGLVRVAPERLVVWAVAVPALLAAVGSDLDLPTGRRPPFALVDDLLWEIGDGRLGGRKERTPIWFCRRLWDPAARRRVLAMAAARPHARQRILLASSRPERLRDIAVPGAIVVPIRDVLRAPDEFVVSGHILGARIGGVALSGSGDPIQLSEDGTALVILGGEPIYFRSPRQIDVIKNLVAASRTGKRLRASDLSPHKTLRRLFGEEKWTRLSPHLRSIKGFWAFDV